MADSSELPETLTRDEVIAELTGPGQSHELEPVLVGAATVRAFKNAPKSLRQLFADTRSDATVHGLRGRALDLRRRPGATPPASRRLLPRDYGVGKGDRVAISMRNFPEWILAFTAVTSIGAIAVAMNALWRPEEMEYGLRDSGAKVLFADQERLDRLADCSPDLDVQVIAVRPSGRRRAARALRGLLAGIGAVDMPAADVAARTIRPPSSTPPARPAGQRACVSSHRNIISALLSWELDGQVAAEVMGVEPPRAGRASRRPCWPCRCSTSPARTRSTSSSYRAPAEDGLHVQAGTRRGRRADRGARRSPRSSRPAAMTGDLVRIASQTERDLSQPDDRRRRRRAARARAGQADRRPRSPSAMPNTGWGMTETNAIGTGIGGPAYLRAARQLRPRLVGAGPEGDRRERRRRCRAGERGELLVRGTSVFRGYWNRPEVNAEVFIDGWFRTGDVAYLDDEGFLFIVDRIKDLIIRGGENIGCGQVEAALVLHPAVHEAAVYGVPDERLGEEVGGHPLRRAVAGRRTRCGHFLAEHLARFEVPRYIRVSSEPLPRTASGKILKRELREAALAAMPKPEHRRVEADLVGF